MKKLFTFILACTASIFTSFSQNIIFSENFESIVPPALPSGWTQEKASGSTLIEWETLSGGHQGNPPYAAEGNYNAIFQYQSSNGEATKLISPVIDLSDVIKPELRFYHAQDIWFAGEEDWDQLKVYYKRGEDSAWVMIAEYLYPVTDWEYRTILLPDSSLSSTYYIAFEGITGYGHGTCIDDIKVVETGLIPLYIESVEINQASGLFIPTGTSNNPIIRIDINAQGNEGTLNLDSIAIRSLNTSDNDIITNGVKLYVTYDTIFAPLNLLASSNFTSGNIIFNNLNYTLTRGVTSFWLAYDIKEDINHEMYGHIADAMIKESSIKIENNYYPYLDKSPTGSRTIYESIFLDDFETNKGWRFTGDFERAKPLGLHANTLGNADPDYAYSGEYIIGTDLTIDGNYTNSIPDTGWVAQMPTLNLKYYKDITFAYYRWLNIQNFEVDKARILLNSDEDTIWDVLWNNPTLSIVNENLWSYHTFNISSYFNRKEKAQLKFTLGSTNSSLNYTGWNIDDVILVGNYITKDVGVTEWISPLSGCGHNTSEEYVTIRIKNYAGEDMTSPLPVSYSFNGGVTIKYDTIYTTIPVDGYLDYPINKPANLSVPGWYNNVYATTHLAGDEDASNNKLTTKIFITPTYTLPYIQNFETNYGYYLSGGRNSLWEYGTPAGTIINSAASGTKAWVINLDGDYLTDDSSYLESPCFNFTENDSIIFEFKCKGISEDKTDGLSILYSFDEGENWIPLPNDHDYYWNWYNETNISELELPGIDTTNGQWLTFRQLLPPAFSNQGTVKFRFVFESNTSTNYEGFGIDDIKIYDAPYDVGVSSLTYPFDRCEWSDTTHVKIQVKNYGPTPVKTGTKIPLVMKFNSLTIKDTLALTQDLTVNGSIPFTFANTVNMSYSGAYDFTIYTKLESNTYFYNETTSNDTLYATVNVLGMPRYNPFPNQIGDNPIDTFLVAGKDYVSYYWTRPSLPDTTTLTTDTLFVKNSEGWYKVTVTNTNTCQASDSVEVVNSEIDLAMDHIYTDLVDSCERVSLTEISVRFINKSVTTLETDDTVALAYQINDSEIVRDTLIVTTPIANNETGNFTFSIPADFRAQGNYTFKVFTDFLKDLDHSDDSLIKTFSTKGFVDINFAYDTIYTSQADTLKLTPSTAHSAYSDYLWSPGGSTNDTLDVTQNISQWYKVLVSDIIACESDSDSVYVETYDMGIINLNSPANRCENNITGSTDINVRIKNYSGNTYNSSTPLTFMYNFNGEGWTEKNMTLGTTLIPNAETDLSVVDINRSIPGEYTVQVYLKSAIDANNSNDSINDIFETYPLPSANLAYDTIFTSRADTVVLVADPGWGSYTWNTGSTNDSLFITSKNSSKYYVDVEDEQGCGTASDTTWIITYNVGVNSLVSPKSACEHSTTESVIISIKNYGQDTLLNGMEIPVGYILDANSPVYETMTLPADLLPGKTTYYTFDSKVDISSINTFKFKVFTSLTHDVNTANDTLEDAIKTYGYPIIELGDDIYTQQPDTVLLIAQPGYNFYKWNEGTKNDTLFVSKPESFNYIVTVTDINGCSTIDSAKVYTTNIRASALVSPVTTCEFTNSEQVIVEIENSCYDTIAAGGIIAVSYRLNTGSLVTENHTLSADFLPGNTVEHTFSSNVDLTSNTNHNFKIFAKYSIDVYTADTASTSIEEVGYPEFNLGDDILTTSPVGTVLSAPAGYAAYTWQDGATTANYTVSYPATKTYSVTVTDSYGCSGSDELTIYTYDVKASQLLSPVSQCELSNAEEVTFNVINNSQDTLLSGETIRASYILNNNAAVTENFNLSATLLPGATVEYTFVQKADLSVNQTHQLKLFAKLDNIDVETNDSLTASVDYQKPIFDLGDDVNVNAEQYIIDAGAVTQYDSYLWFNGSTNRTYTVDVNNQTPNFYYAVTVTNSYSCTATDSIMVTFTITPDLQMISMSSPVSDCWQSGETYPVQVTLQNVGEINIASGTPVSIGFIRNNEPAVIENINLSAALNANQTISHTFAAEIDFASAQVYTFKPFVKYSADANATNDTLTVNIDITQPDVEFDYDTVYFSTNAEIEPNSSFVSYAWSTGEQTKKITVSQTGTYTVTVTDSYGCSGSGSVYCEKLTGIENLIEGNGYHISYFPNPVSEKLQVQFNNSKSMDVVMEIITPNGQIIYNREYTNIQNTTEKIDVNQFANGIYYIRFRINNEHFTRKIIIQ